MYIDNDYLDVEAPTYEQSFEENRYEYDELFNAVDNYNLARFSEILQMIDTNSIIKNPNYETFLYPEILFYLLVDVQKNTIPFIEEVLKRNPDLNKIVSTSSLFFDDIKDYHVTMPFEEVLEKFHKVAIDSYNQELKYHEEYPEWIDEEDIEDLEFTENMLKRFDLIFDYLEK